VGRLARPLVKDWRIMSKQAARDDPVSYESSRDRIMSLDSIRQAIGTCFCSVP